MTPWMNAIDKLKSLGYRITLGNGKLKYAYQRKGNPSQNEIALLLGVLATHKGETLNDPFFLIDQTIQKINEAYSPGTLDLLKRNTPEGWAKLRTLEGEINERALKGDVDGLKRVLEGYERLIVNVVNAFRPSEERRGV